MQRSIALALLLLAAAEAAAVAAEEELYTDKYDYIEPQAILENDRLREQYYKCFAKTGPCLTPDAKYFRDIFDEAVVTRCRKCTDKQKESFTVIAEWYTKNQPDKWLAIFKDFLTEQ